MDFFKVNVHKYDSSKNFDVVCPSSLNNPKSNSVMFILEANIDKASAFDRVENCLIFWPVGLEIPASIRDKHAIAFANNPHNAYCRFFVDNDIKNIQSNEKVDFIDGSFISPAATIGLGTTIMPGCYIGSGVSIGSGCYVGSGAKLIGQVFIGNNVLIKENAVIGADGLTTDRDTDGSALTMPQFGSVVIEDNVQIGANSVIARGAIDETRICKGAKIDNLCFISHNVLIGENTFVVGESIMFGSSSTGKNSMISGNSTIRNSVHIGDSSLVGMGSVVTKSVPDNAVVKGNPAK